MGISKTLPNVDFDLHFIEMGSLTYTLSKQGAWYKFDLNGKFDTRFIKMGSLTHTQPNWGER